MSKVLYPGSFNPITKGHMDIIKQASNLFDLVVVAVMYNPLKKKEFFTIDERVEIIREIYKNCSNVKVIVGNGAAVDVALKEGCSAIVRGIRNFSDFDYEMQLARINMDISLNKVNTICLFASPEFINVSSSAVREVFNLGKSVDKYVDVVVRDKMLVKRIGFNE